MYISDAKVDMLLPQVPGRERRKIATTLGADIKVFKASITEESTPLETRVARLLAVESHILKREKVGSINEAAPWILDTLDARSLVIKDAVAFVNRERNPVIVLAGSAHHLVGSTRPAGGISASGVPMFFSNLRNMLVEAGEVLTLPEPESVPTLFFPGVDRSIPEVVVRRQFDWSRQLRWLSAEVDGPIQRISFLAKRLLSEGPPAFEHHVVLATPLYVALAD